MPSEKTVTVVLLGIAAAGLLAVTGYNLWIAPPAQGLEAVRLEEPAGESSWFAELDAPVVPDAEHPLDLNAADEEELALLPGIGETLAGRIAAYREEHGPLFRAGGPSSGGGHRRKDLCRSPGPGDSGFTGVNNL